MRAEREEGGGASGSAEEGSELQVRAGRGWEGGGVEEHEGARRRVLNCR